MSLIAALARWTASWRPAASGRPNGPVVTIPGGLRVVGLPARAVPQRGPHVLGVAVLAAFGLLSASSISLGADTHHPFLVFFPKDGVHGAEPWRSDGTEAGTWLIRDIYPGPFDGVYVPELAVMDGIAYFTARGRHHRGVELWRTDGTSRGTWMLRDIAPTPADSGPSGLTVAGHTLFFAAGDGVHGRRGRHSGQVRNHRFRSQRSRSRR
jgi:ELWxxDGT repeat protein